MNMKKNVWFVLITLLFSIQISELSAQAKKGLYTAELGIQAYTFRKSFPQGVEATLDSIKAMGFKEVEGTGGKVTPEEFRKMCDARDLVIPSTGAGYDELVKNPMEVVRKAKVLGAKYVMCAWIPHKSGAFNLDNAKKAVEDFNTAGKILKENGLTFCYHIHGYEFWPYEDGTLFDYIAKNTNPEYVSFELDVLWAIHGGADPVSLIKKYGSRWKLVHLKDLKKGVKGDRTGNTPQENDVILGTGQADIAGIIREGNKVGIKHFFIEDESNQVNYQVPRSIAYIKSLKK